MTSGLSALIVFSLEILFPFPLQPFFHGLPILCGISFKGRMKFLFVFVISIVQNLAFDDHQYSIPFDLISIWIIDLGLRSKMVNSSGMYGFLLIFSALFISHFPHLLSFNFHIVVLSMVIWYLICVSAFFGRKNG